MGNMGSGNDDSDQQADRYLNNPRAEWDNEDDSEYYDYHPLCSVPFVFHELKPRGDLPKARSGHRIVADSYGNFYSLGGYNPEDNATLGEAASLLKELWKFNMSTLRWTRVRMKGDVPKLVISFGVACIDDLMFVHGGTGVPFASRGSNSLYVCRLKDGCWKNFKLKSDPKGFPPELYGQALVFDPEERSIYTIGGTSGQRFTNGIAKINLKNMTAEKIVNYDSFDVDEPGGSYRHEAVLYKEKVYIFGGGTSTTNIGFEKIPVFDLTTMEWQYVKTSPDLAHGIPAARKFHGLVSLDHHVFIVGGGANLPNVSMPEIIGDMWRFDLETSEWTYILAMPRPTFFHSATITPAGQMIIFGGVEKTTDYVRTNNIYTMWLKVPSLAEIAWIAFLNNCPYISQISPNNLLNMGVPRSFIARLQ